MGAATGAGVAGVGATGFTTGADTTAGFTIGADSVTTGAAAAVAAPALGLRTTGFFIAFSTVVSAALTILTGAFLAVVSLTDIFFSAGDFLAAGTLGAFGALDSFGVLVFFSVIGLTRLERSRWSAP